jgi:hypothetical protein
MSMSEDEAIDARLSALFVAPEAAPDEAFVARIERAVLAEKRFAAARAAAWRRFRGEAAASVAVVSAFALLWRLAPAGLTLDPLAFGPAAAALLLLFLWFAVELRPAATGR